MGVVIGTTSIVVMISLGIGMKEALLSEYESYGGLKSIDVNSPGRYDDTDKDKDPEKTKETLKAKGFEKLDPNDENGIAVKFAKKCEENKKTETDVSNRANDGSDATGSTTENNTEPQKELSYAKKRTLMAGIKMTEEC